MTMMTTAIATDLPALRAELQEAETAWTRLDGGDPSSFLRQQPIAERIAELQAAIVRAEAAAVRQTERDALVAGLAAEHDAAQAALHTQLADVLAALPTLPQLAALYTQSRIVADVAHVLHGATAQRQFARPLDALDEIHRALSAAVTLCIRTRLPGVVPKPEPQPWHAQADRLRELLAHERMNDR